MASTNAGLCQGKMTWCFKVRGNNYHWVIDLYQRLNLPVIPAAVEALVKCVKDRAAELNKQQTEAWKQQRIRMKVTRTEDQEARKTWVKQQAVTHSYGNSEDGGDDDGQYRVCTLFSTKNSRTFQGLSRIHFSIFQGLQEGENQANIMPHQMLNVESAPIFVSDT